jgi:hypothetical protein
MSFEGKCMGTVSKNGDGMFLLKPDPDDGHGTHLIGQLPKDIIKFEVGETYEVVFRKIARPPDE